ncbi:MAG: dihydroorotate dehydrogenase (quinone), partial [Leifsonia flava]
MYEFIFRTFFARMDPERAHHLGFVVIRMLGWPVIGPIVARFTRSPKPQPVRALGLTFPTPFGVAAGFDKNAHAV